MTEETAAVVGAAGGVGATRLAVECGAALARAGRDVAVLDAAYATQGLAAHVAGRVDPDVTEVVTGDATLDDGLIDHPATEGVDGRFAVCPAHAPFERIARAKTPDAAEVFGDLVETAAGRFDHVIVDTPPVAANQSVAVVTATDRTAVVTTPGRRGVDALQRTRGRLADLGVDADLVVANRVDGEDTPDADLQVPAGEADVAAGAPAALDPESRVGPAATAVAEALFDLKLDLAFDSGLLDGARRRLQ